MKSFESCGYQTAGSFVSLIPLWLWFDCSCRRINKQTKRKEKKTKPNHTYTNHKHAQDMGDGTVVE